jgi:hypothetical protein
MSHPKLYLETTIPSYLTARRSRDLRIVADQETTQEWWDERRTDFDLFISEAVLREVSRGDAGMVAARLACLRGLPVLGETPLANRLTKHLLAAGIMPAKAEDDAAHVALAAAHGMDFLLTWNCTHINNRAIARQIERVCAGCGVECPVICTPNELMEL